jgi:hypothetical protein
MMVIYPHQDTGKMMVIYPHQDTGKMMVIYPHQDPGKEKISLGIFDTNRNIYRRIFAKIEK